MSLESFIEGNSWQSAFAKLNARSRDVFVLDRKNGHCLAFDFGLPPEQRQEFMGHRWLEFIVPPDDERMVEFLQSEDYGPFVYRAMGRPPKWQIGTSLDISMVRINFGPVAVCYGHAMAVMF